MEETTKQTDSLTHKKSLFGRFIEIIGWLQIVASPFLAASIVGAIIYFSKPNPARLIIAIAIVLFGLITGIVWATKIWRTKRTTHFMSGIMATPDLDNKEDVPN